MFVVQHPGAATKEKMEEQDHVALTFSQTHQLVEIQEVRELHLSKKPDCLFWLKNGLFSHNQTFFFHPSFEEWEKLEKMRLKIMSLKTSCKHFLILKKKVLDQKTQVKNEYQAEQNFRMTTKITFDNKEF